MEKVQKVRTAVIGCGMISSIYIRNLKNLFYITDLVAVSNRGEEAARKQAEKFGIERVLTPDEVAASEDIELVVNLTPPAAHYGIIKKMLLAGKHVYTEKMFTTKLEEAEELVRLADEKHLYLGVAPDTILGAGIQTARNIIGSGLIGEITSVQVKINRNQSQNSETFRFLRNDGGSLPYDVGIYYIGALLALAGPVRSVCAFGNPAPVHAAEFLYASSPEESWQIPGNNTTAAALRFESGAVGSILFDGNTVNAQKHGFTVYGTKGILEVGDPNEFGGTPRLTLPGQEEITFPFTHGYDGKSVFSQPEWFDGYGHRGVGAAEMAWALRGGRKNNRCSKEYGLHCMEVLIGMEKSAESGIPFEPKSRFIMDPLPAGYYSGSAASRQDAERSLI